MKYELDYVLDSALDGIFIVDENHRLVLFNRACEELFGISNALVGAWPVVAIEDGKAVIKEFRSIPDWYAKHGELLRKHMSDYGQMFDQRG